MTKSEHLLNYLSKECNYIRGIISEALKYGLDDPKFDYLYCDFKNRERISYELRDLLAVIELLNEEKIIDYDVIKSGVIDRKEVIRRHIDSCINIGIITVDSTIIK